MRSFFSLLILVLFINVSYAQRFEIGLFAGGNNIIGDVDTEYYVKPTGYTYGGLLKWNKTERLAIRANISLSIVNGGGDDHKPTYPYPSNLYTSYHKGIGNGDIVFEWSFFPYDLRKSGAKTPYVYLGLGALIYEGKHGKPYSGDIAAEPHATQLVLSVSRFEATPTIPFGVGYKYALNHNLVLAADLGFRYSYSDNLDNSAVNEFGNLNSNDWLTTIGLTLTYAFGRDPCACGQ